MQRRKFIGMALAASLATVGLAACSDSGDKNHGAEGGDKGTIRVWFMEGSLSDESRNYLEQEFAKQNPGATLKVEVQQWDGIVSKLQTSLASKTESPDIVEIGNTQATAFTTVNAFADVTNMKSELGGDKLIPSFVDAATVDGKIYAYPLYAGARGVFYRKDLMQKANIPVPQTIKEFKDAAIKLEQANPENVKNFSGIYLAAVDVHGLESFLFSDGFDYAKKEGDKWVGQVTTPASMDALKDLQDLFKNGTHYGLDSTSGQKSFERYFNAGQVGMLIATGNVGTKIDKKLWDEGKVGVMAVPSDKPGVAGKVFAGGSDIAISNNSQHKELARKAMQLIFSPKFQEMIAKDGWVPGNVEYGKYLDGAFRDIAVEAVKNSKLTPNTPAWGVAVGDNKVTDFFTRIAKGEDLQKTADNFNKSLDELLNQQN